MSRSAPARGRATGTSGDDNLTSLVGTVSGPKRPSKPKRGVVLHRTVKGPLEQSYLLYLPADANEWQGPLVLIHGHSRNPQTVIDVFRPYADQYRTMLIAPIFDKRNAADYQRLGLNRQPGGGCPPHVALGRVLADVEHLTDCPTQRFYLYGHSGGAQFAHRYAMAFPDAVIRCAISAAGWYTLPDNSVPFPYGIKAHAGHAFIAPDMERFLTIPIPRLAIPVRIVLPVRPGRESLLQA